MLCVQFPPPPCRAGPRIEPQAKRILQLPKCSGKIPNPAAHTSSQTQAVGEGKGGEGGGGGVGRGWGCEHLGSLDKPTRMLPSLPIPSVGALRVYTSLTGSMVSKVQGVCLSRLSGGPDTGIWRGLPLQEGGSGMQALLRLRAWSKLQRVEYKGFGIVTRRGGTGDNLLGFAPNFGKSFFGTF